MATSNPTGRARNTTPPAVGSRPSVRIDDDMRDDLAVIMSAGATYTEAVRHAVRLLADTYRAAWDFGDVPDGTAPHIVGVRYVRADGTTGPVAPSHPSHQQVSEAAARDSRAA